MAHDQIERYIAAVAERLQMLPADQREQDLREIRQHLEALAAGYTAQGMDETAAAAEAVRQFGHAEQLGAELDSSWKRHHPTLLQTLGRLVVLYLCFVGAFALIGVAIGAPAGFLTTGLIQAAVFTLMFPLFDYLAKRKRKPQAKS